MESIDLRLALGALRQEINNGLQSIVLHADVLGTSDGLAEEQRGCAAVVQAEALKIAEILQRLCNGESLKVRPYTGGETMVDLSPRGT